MKSVLVAQVWIPALATLSPLIASPGFIVTAFEVSTFLATNYRSMKVGGLAEKSNDWCFRINEIDGIPVKAQFGQVFGCAGAWWINRFLGNLNLRQMKSTFFVVAHQLSVEIHERSVVLLVLGNKCL